jgi:hypothetical protein
MNGFIAILLQVHTRSNVFNTSTVQRPSEFSSADDFSAATECLTHNSTRLQLLCPLYLLGNTTNLEESVVSRILSLQLSSHSHLLPYQVQSYVTTDGQPASLSWNKAPIWGLRSDLDYCLTVAGLSMFIAVETWLPSRCLAMGAWFRLHNCGSQASCQQYINENFGLTANNNKQFMWQITSISVCLVVNSYTKPKNISDKTYPGIWTHFSELVKIGNSN